MTRPSGDCWLRHLTLWPRPTFCISLPFSRPAPDLDVHRYTRGCTYSTYTGACTFSSRLSSSLARVGFGDRPGSHRLNRHRAHGMIYHAPFVISRVNLALRPLSSIHHFNDLTATFASPRIIANALLCHSCVTHLREFSHLDERNIQLRLTHTQATRFNMRMLNANNALRYYNVISEM